MGNFLPCSIQNGSLFGNNRLSVTFLWFPKRTVKIACTSKEDVVVALFVGSQFSFFFCTYRLNSMVYYLELILEICERSIQKFATVSIFGLKMVTWRNDIAVFG